MKKIHYKVVDEYGIGIEEPKSVEYNAYNLALAKTEAYNGEYTIEDDGEPDPTHEPTQLDRVEAQATYTAMMTDTLLEV